MKVHTALALAAGMFFAIGVAPALADSMSTPSSNSMASPMSSSNTMSSGGMSSTGQMSSDHMSSDHMAAPDTHKHKKKHAAGAMQSGGMASGTGDSMAPANTQTH